MGSAQQHAIRPSGVLTRLWTALVIGVGMLACVGNATAISPTPIARFGLLGVADMTYAPVAGLIAVRTEAPDVQVLDATTGRTVAMIPAPVYSMALSADGTTIAASGPHASDFTTLWDVGSGQEIGRLPGRSGVMAFSPDGRVVAGVSVAFDADGNPLPGIARTVMLWNVATREETVILGSHSSVTSVAFTPDGTVLATGSWNGTVKLWDVAARREIATLEGHDDVVWALAFGPDGRVLASGSWDHTVRLWDVGIRREIAALAAHTGGSRPSRSVTTVGP